MFSLLGSIFSILSIIPLILYIRASKRRKSIQSQIRYGMICKNCHQEISNQPIYIKEEELLCKQCKRDEALNDVLNKKPNLKKKLNIVYSKNWMKWFLGIIGTSLLIQMFGLFFGIKFFSFLGGILTFTGQLLNYLNFLHYSIKKDPIK